LPGGNCLLSLVNLTGRNDRRALSPLLFAITIPPREVLPIPWIAEAAEFFSAFNTLLMPAHHGCAPVHLALTRSSSDLKILKADHEALRAAIELRGPAPDVSRTADHASGLNFGANRHQGNWQ
jgi:hypothetical protein